MFERLFDHQQAEIVERAEMFDVRQGVSGVRVDGEENIRITTPHFADYPHIPTGFDLELDALITQREIAIDALEQLIHRRLNSQTDTDRNAFARTADQCRKRLAL